jgi:hypothetical protein
MLGLPLLDVVIGLVFIYLLLSLIVTAAGELVASWLKRRPATLWRGIVSLLGDESAAEELYSHPLIKGLTGTSWFEKYRKGLPFRQRPSYIPSRTFALALLDSLSPLTAGGRTSNHLRAALALRLSADANDPLAKSISVLLDDAAGDIEKLKTNLETWFNNGMDRVTGWYKRRTQYILLVISMAVTVWINADTLVLAKALIVDSSTRTALVDQAQQTVTDNRVPTAKESITTLGGISLPLGWQDVKDAADWRKQFREHFFGWLLTALAVSMGAPFWFDLLGKVITVRGTGKPPDAKAS